MKQQFTAVSKRNGARKILKKSIYQYTAVFEPDEEGGYTATIPSLPGCISEGDTFEAASKNIREAASLYLEVMKKGREDIPTEMHGIIVAPVHINVRA